jgi:retron-type reverse transcriptase
LVSLLSRPIIHDNGASIKGKGLQFAIKRLITHLSRFYREHQSNNGYALIVDFKGFFDNIDYAVLFQLLDSQIHDSRVRELTRRFIAVFGDGKSLGLGSQVSQIAAVFYPNHLDHYIKEILRIKYYGRYMDDLYLIHRDRSYLEWIKEVCTRLKITINEKKTKIVQLNKGMLFLKGKYSLLENGKVLRLPCKMSALRMRRKLRKFKVLLNEGRMSFEDMRTAYQSWRGTFLKRFEAYHTVGRVDRLYSELFYRKRYLWFI